LPDRIDVNSLRLGATWQPSGEVRFRVWAPRARELALHIVGQGPSRLMERTRGGYHEASVTGLEAGARYYYRINGVDRPDPASRFQPEGVHRASALGRSDFRWTDAGWPGVPWPQMVIYEAHVGMFTSAGTFEAMIDELDELARLGVTALELMPVAQFSGGRNWGYDGVHPFAVQNTYGGPEGLRKLVDACHARSMALVLDVVYNHLGPEGNYLAEFGPYFSRRHRTPWGPAMNFDGPRRGPVRDFFLQNALMWIREYHIDGFRLDATHAIIDESERHFLAELAELVHACGRALGRQVHVIAENNANDPVIVLPGAAGGHQLDAQLDDDFQRSLHALLTGERDGYYADFGRLEDFAKAYQTGFALTGQFSSYRGKPWGTAADDVPAHHFVAYAQSHDTVGNRPRSERLGQVVDFESLKLAAAAVILSPAIPFLFMGEEYDEPAPFHYFTSHLDPGLGQAVREGRIREFARLHWAQQPPDPQATATFSASCLHRGLASQGRHACLWHYYQALLRLRRQHAAVRQADRQQGQVELVERDALMVARRHDDRQEICVCLNFSARAATSVERAVGKGWTLLLDSSDTRWGGQTAGVKIHLPAPESLTVAGMSCLLLVRDTR
jgi:maltooligosyltrehalose trehalohydrolase